jgi:hypothetical protein
MSQQINLINPALIKQKDYLTVVNIGTIYGVLSGLMLVWYTYHALQVAQLTNAQQGLVDEVAQTQTALAQLVASRAPHSPDPALLQQLTFLESKQDMQAQMLQTIEQRKSSPDRGLANYMRGFARQTMAGLWLTGFTIDETNKTMTVRGRSLEAETLPNYVQQLSKEPVFSGKHFGSLRIQQAELPQASAVPAPLVADPSNQPASTTSAVALPLWIEFELKGLERLSVQTATTASGEIKS